jgi:hypothetical protein
LPLAAITLAVWLWLIGTPAPVLASDDGKAPTVEEVRSHIEEHGYRWTAGYTPLSDLSLEEFRRLCGGPVQFPQDYETRLREIQSRPPAYPLLDLPSRFDWADSAAVSPVRDQECGDCWAQAAVAAVESQMIMHDSDTTRLSVQQAIDCNFYEASCSGGWHTSVYQLYKAVGAVTQACYPYVGLDQTCAQDTCDLILNLAGWEFIDTTLVSLKTHLMSNGPLAVWMQTWPDIANYTGGCYEHEPGPIELGHLVLLVGWDDSICGGTGGWHVKNSWGTEWGEDGYFWIKYWTGYVGALAATIDYIPRESAMLVYESCVIDDSSGDGDGKPDPGETVTLPVTLGNKRWETATGVTATIMTTTPGIQVLTGSATFPDIASGTQEQSDPPHFSFSVDSLVACGRRIQMVISMTCDQGNFTGNFDMLAGEAETVYLDKAETDSGWTIGVGGDDASLGAWTWGDPKGSLGTDSAVVQTELDRTPGSGFNSFFTQNAKRHQPPDHRDVDGGKTTLLSPTVDLTDYASALLRYWRWYTNETGDTVDDNWIVDVSADSGLSWVNLESETAGERAWTAKEFDLGTHVSLSDRIMLRFIASDYGGESTVEAAVDDIEITGCPWWIDTTPPTVEVVSPNGGEELVGGSQVDVEWSGDDDFGVRDYVVTASYDDGLTHDDTLGVAGRFDTMLVWDVPEGDHPSCRIGIRATDRGYNSSFDQSDSAFSIILDPAAVSTDGREDLPDEVTLVGAQANPFTGSTHIFFGLPRAAQVSLGIYDTRGRLVRKMLDRTMPAGYHAIPWSGETRAGARAAPGIYFVCLKTEGITRTAKVILAR